MGIYFEEMPEYKYYLARKKFETFGDEHSLGDMEMYENVLRSELRYSDELLDQMYEMLKNKNRTK